MPQFHLHSMLADQGLSFVRRNEDGTIQVRDMREGQQERTVDLPKMLSGAGIPDDAPIIYNHSIDPVDETPVSIADRFRMGLGNEKGKAKFLSKKFEDVQVNENGHLVVKDKGVWHRVDPSNFQGDPWKLAKELASEVAENVGTLADMAMVTAGTAGGAAAGALAGPGGAVAGGIAGAGAGGAASNRLRTSLGRVMGTYEATPEEEINDLIIDTAFSLGGQALGAGAKPLASLFAKGMKSIGKNAPPAVRNTLAGVWGKLNGAGSEAMHTLFDAPEKVVSRLSVYAKNSGTVDDLIQAAAESKVKTATSLLDDATKALPRMFGQKLKRIVGSPKAARMTVNPAEMVDNVFRSLDEMGVGVFNAKTRAFHFMDDATATARSQAGRPFTFLGSDEIKQLEPILRTLKTFGKGGTVQGNNSVNMLRGLEGHINGLSSALRKSQSPALQRAATQTKRMFSEVTKDQFERVGLGADYAEMLASYGRNVDAVKSARRMLQNPASVEAFVRKLASAPGRNVAAKSMEKQLLDLTGARGEALMRKLAIEHAVEKLAPMAPKFGLVQTAGALGTANFLMGGGSMAAAGAVAVPAIAASSPRVTANSVRTLKPYLSQGAEWARRLTPKMSEEFIKNPKAVETFIRNTALAGATEAKEREAILRSVGELVGAQ